MYSFCFVFFNVFNCRHSNWLVFWPRLRLTLARNTRKCAKKTAVVPQLTVKLQHKRLRRRRPLLMGEIPVFPVDCVIYYSGHLLNLINVYSKHLQIRIYINTNVYDYIMLTRIELVHGVGIWIDLLGWRLQHDRDSNIWNEYTCVRLLVVRLGKNYPYSVSSRVPISSIFF